MAGKQATTAWGQIRDDYFPRGNVDRMLALRKGLYEEIHAAQERRGRESAVLNDDHDMLRARAIAASLFILMLEKKKAAEMLHPYVDGKKYPNKDFVNRAAIDDLERQASVGDLNAAVAVGSILTQTASLCYRSFLQDYQTGLDLTKRAEALLADREKHYKKASPDVFLPFLLTRHENLLHLSLFQWRAGKEQMREARKCLEDSMRELTIAYERLLARPQHVPLAGSVEALLTQTLGSLAERLWVEEPGTGWDRARIYRSLQTRPPAPREIDEQIPGRSVDSCRRGYAFILASRIEADDTATEYRLSIALAKDAERCFDDLAKTLREEPHAWKIRARIQRLRCYIQAEKTKPAKSLYEELVKEVESIKEKDPEEYDFAKGSLALSHTWTLEREAEEAPYEEREEKWRKCFAQAEEVTKREDIPGRLERDGLLHQGRALLNLAICLRRKGGSAAHRLSDDYKKRGCTLIQQAITQARDRHRAKIIAAGHLFLAEGLRESDPSAAAESLREAKRLLAQAKTTYLQRELDRLYSDPIVEDGFVTLSLNMPYKEGLVPALQAAYLDYLLREEMETPGSNPQTIIRRVAKRTPWGEKQVKRILKQINERRGIPTESKPKKVQAVKAAPENDEGQGSRARNVRK